MHYYWIFAFFSFLHSLQAPFVRNSELRSGITLIDFYRHKIEVSNLTGISASSLLFFSEKSSQIYGVPQSPPLYNLLANFSDKHGRNYWTNCNEFFSSYVCLSGCCPPPDLFVLFLPRFPGKNCPLYRPWSRLNWPAGIFFWPEKCT